MRVPSAHPLSTSNACSQKVKTTQRKLHGIQQVRKTTIITTTTTTTKKKKNGPHFRYYEVYVFGEIAWLCLSRGCFHFEWDQHE